MSKSFFLYIHKSLCKTPNAWKIGKAMTPYSAVRARQKFQWEKFSLDYLYWGRPEHIDILESSIKESLNQCSGTVLNNGSSQTELFMIHIDKIKEQISQIIQDKCLDVAVIDWIEPYSASRSSDCPLQIPGETISHIELSERVAWRFGDCPKETHFNNLFSYD